MNSMCIVDPEVSVIAKIPGHSNKDDDGKVSEKGQDGINGY